MDGSELESRPVADQPNRVRTFERFVLSWSYDVVGDVPDDVSQIVDGVLNASIDNARRGAIPPNARQVLVNRLQLKDIFSRDKAAEWRRTFSFDSKAAFVNDHEIAVYDPEAARLQIFSIRDGEPIVDYPLRTELKQVDSVRVEKRLGLYVATLFEETDGRRSGNVMYQPVRSLDRTKLANMEVFCFNDSGEMVWGAPARLKDFMQPLHFADEVPVLVYVRSKGVSKSAPRFQLEAVLA